MREYKDIEELNQCPFCGHNEYYQKESYYGEFDFRKRFDGKRADNKNMYDNPTHKLISEFYYCSNCNKKIARIK